MFSACEPSRGLLDWGGTVRLRSPEETWAELRDVCAVVGITRLANITGLDVVGVPTWMAVRPLALSISVSQGKGLSDEAAQVSAAMEAIEVFHAEHLVPRGASMSLAEAASMDCCVALDDLPIRPMVKVTPDSTVEWIPGECLNSGEAIWLPRQMMDLNLTERNEENWIFASSTNGLASGNSREEALIHGICEVVERDHSAFFQIKQQFAPYMASTRLRLETIDDAGVIDLIRRVENAGLSITVWDMATDLGLPCFSAVVYDENRSTLYPTKASGAGCHPLKHIALARAVTEALQSRLTFVAGARDDIYWETYREEIPINAAKNRAWLEERQYEACQTDYAEIPDFCRGATNATGLLQGLVRALAEKGWERVIATDLTSTDLGVPVTHVAIPGMEPYLRGTDYCPGRRMMALINELLQL